MKQVKEFNGVMNRENLKLLLGSPDNSLFCLSENKIDIRQTLKVAYLLAPEFVEVEGHVFFKDIFDSETDQAIEELHEMQKKHTKKEIEIAVNAWSLGGFFIGDDSDEMDDENILKQFAEVLSYFWSRKLAEDFPKRKMRVEYGDGLGGELGIAITFYEE